MYISLHRLHLLRSRIDEHFPSLELLSTSLMGLIKLNENQQMTSLIGTSLPWQSILIITSKDWRAVAGSSIGRPLLFTF